MRIADFESIPFWDHALSEPPLALKDFDLGADGTWSYIVEAPSLWRVKEEHQRPAVNAALTHLGDKRIGSYKPEPAAFDTLTIANTMSCNLGCTYCYNYSALGAPTHPKRSVIEADFAHRAIDKLFNESPAGSPLSLQFIGGEPLIRWESLRATVDLALTRADREGRELRVGINTNATLLTEERLRWVNERPVYLYLSYDGPANLHDANRPTAAGTPSFELVARNIELFMEHYTKPVRSCRMTLDLGKGKFTELIDDAVARGFNDVSIGFDSKSFSETPDLLSTVLPDIRDLEIACEAAYRSGKLFRFSWFNEVWFQLQRGVPRYRPCSAGDGQLAIDPSGKLYPCHRYVGGESGAVGHIMDPVQPARPERFHENTENADCRACWARRICGGECHAVLDDIGDSMYRKQVLCVMRRAIFESAIRLFVRFKANAPDVLANIERFANAYTMET